MKKRSPDSEASDSEAGVALVMVLILMLVGFVIASMIAAAVLFTFGANQSNKRQTQAYVAAESGRDAMLAAVMANGCATSIANSSNPDYRSVTASFADASGPTSCLSSTASAVITITSTGYGSSNDSTRVVATYQRLATYSHQPGGSLAYFSGTFKLTQSNYTGDVVIRDGNYTCNSASTIDGDLWVPRGGVDISAKCNITGSIFARDAISITGAQSVVGTAGNSATGDLVCQTCAGFGGNAAGITVAASNSVVTHDILSGGDVTLKNTTIKGNVKAYGAVAQQNSTINGTVTQNVRPTPAVFNPTLDDVYGMTNWLDLGFSTSLWGSGVQWTVVPASGCSANRTPGLMAALTGGNTRYGFDYSACTSNVTITLGAGNIKSDAVFLVPASANMGINITGTITSTGASATPQLFFIHADGAPATTGPNCGTSTPLAPNDTFDQTNNTTVSANLMFYSPCGMGRVPNSNQVTAFNGQFYAADNTPTGQTSHWVQPAFNCQPMAWSPLINLGCYIRNAAGTPDDGTITPNIQPPALVSQVEQ